MRFRRSNHRNVVLDLRSFADHLEGLGKEGKALRDAASELFNDWLDEWVTQDVFGTEGQLDPRGDHRG